MDYKNILFLVLGLILGVRLADIWDYVQLQRNFSDAAADSVQHINNINNNSNNNNIVEYLRNETRVLCWVMTTPENHLKRAIHVRNTWGQRCTKLLFMSTEADNFLETIKLPVQEGRDYLWSKTREAFKYIYDNHLDDADWFLKADDDAYFIMENLRAFLYTFDAAEPLYFGCKFFPLVEQGYMSGGAGYVLSREALQRFGHIGYPNESLCSHNNLPEDKEMGVCLHNVGVIAGDSRDAEQRERFLPLAPIHLIPVDTSEWYAKYLFYRSPKDVKCCSPNAISFHYIKPKEFYILDYFLYELSAFGVRQNQLDVLPAKANMTALMLRWRDEKKINN